MVKKKRKRNENKRRRQSQTANFFLGFWEKKRFIDAGASVVWPALFGFGVRDWLIGLG